MGVNLDWDIESDAGEHHWIEDPAEAAAHQRAAQRRQRVLLMAAILAGARLYQVDRWRREMLIATVETEALALRIGDRREFMQAQDSHEAWREVQRRAFDDFRAIAPRVQIPGDDEDVDEHSA